MNTDSTGKRGRAIWLALLVALVGLTIAPGFKCTEEQRADGTKVTTFES